MFFFPGVHYCNHEHEVTRQAGQNVTLHVNKTHHDFNSYFWTFEQHLNVREVIIVHNGEVTKNSQITFGNRLILAIEAGSITISNLTVNDSGIFQVHFFTGAKTFKVTVSGESPFHFLQ